MNIYQVSMNICVIIYMIYKHKRHCIREKIQGAGAPQFPGGGGGGAQDYIGPMDYY